ncbi:MAG: DnaD domain protein [Halanaerobiales bacterium]
MTKYERNKKFNLTDTSAAPRINPALAKEIGINESIVLLQLEFWISISKNIEEGKQWTYQSLTDMQEKSFCFWSTSTIRRAIDNLIDKDLIYKDNYNKYKYDRTGWYALNYENIKKLRSIELVKENIYEYSEASNDTILQNETGLLQNDTRFNQNDTTIPDNTTDNTTNKQEEDKAVHETKIINNYKDIFNHSLTDNQKDFIMNCEYSEDIILYSFQLRKEKGGNSFNWIKTTIEDWKNNNLDTLEDIENYVYDKFSKKDSSSNSSENKKMDYNEAIGLFKEYFDCDILGHYGRLDNLFSEEKARKIFELCKKYNIDNFDSIYDICNRTASHPIRITEEYIQNHIINEQSNDLPEYHEIKSKEEASEYHEVKNQERDNPLGEFLPDDNKDKGKQQDGTPAVLDSIDW